MAFSVFTFFRDYHQQNWGNAAFAGLNAIAASYAIIAFMGLRNTVADIWLGLVERLYVSDRVEPVQLMRGRRLAVAPTAEPTWQEVLYRGVAATGSGAHADGDGPFKIFSAPPTAPAAHNRRDTDRAPVDRREPNERRNRRAGDVPEPRDSSAEHQPATVASAGSRAP